MELVIAAKLNEKKQHFKSHVEDLFEKLATRAKEEDLRECKECIEEIQRYRNFIVMCDTLLDDMQDSIEEFGETAAEVKKAIEKLNDLGDNIDIIATLLKIVPGNEVK